MSASDMIIIVCSSVTEVLERLHGLGVPLRGGWRSVAP
jgi:hypothetical protein